MRLIHYSKTPLTAVHSTRHSEDGCGAYKTPGLWVSVEGPDDWLWWCEAEQWGVERLACATEVVLAADAKVLHLSSAAEIDDFTARFEPKDRRGEWDRRIDWPAIRRRWHGLIIAPYCWERRLAMHTSWYYGWDCASWVIWNARAVGELRPLPAPSFSAEAA